MHPLLIAATIACHGTTPPTADTSGAGTGHPTRDAGSSGDTGACENTERRVFDWECTDRDPDALPDCAAAETYTYEGPAGNSKRPYTETCEQRRVWPPSCCMDFSKKTHDGLMYEGMTFLSGRWRRPVVTVSTATDWEALRADNADALPVELPDVDFDEQMVVVVQDWENESCSFTVEDHGIVPVSGGAGVLRVRFGDHSGTCDPCSAESGAIVIYAVDRDPGPPLVCASTVESCD